MVDEETEAKEIRCLSQEVGHDAENREFTGFGTPSLHSSQWRKRSLIGLPYPPAATSGPYVLD